MARALVDNPEQVKVSEIEGGRTSIIQLWVAKPDLGKVIGKQGRKIIIPNSGRWSRDQTKIFWWGRQDCFFGTWQFLAMFSQAE